MIKLVRFLAKNNFNMVTKLKISKRNLEIFGKLTINYLKFIFEKEIFSKKFLKEINK